MTKLILTLIGASFAIGAAIFTATHQPDTDRTRAEWCQADGKHEYIVLATGEWQCEANPFLEDDNDNQREAAQE